MRAEDSRVLRLGAGAADIEIETLQAQLELALVVVRLDLATRGATLTARVLLTTLRRLPLRIALDRSGLDRGTVSELVAAAASIDPSKPLLICDEPPADTTVAIHIGLVADARWVRVAPDGYGAQIATDSGVTMTLGRPANALGNIFAAALAAAEAFKHTARVLDRRQTRHAHLAFCPVSLSNDTTIAPELPARLDLDVALVGAGAIGTATALILSELALGGRVIICDPGRYAAENHETYSLGDARDVPARTRKVDIAGDLLTRSGYDVDKVFGAALQLIGLVDAKKMHAPRIVLAGLDSVEARRETQGLWPDHLIDAATGDTAAQFSHALPGGPCARCFYPERHHGPSPLEELARETGLPVERLARGDDELTDADLANLTSDQRGRLAGQLGKPVCGLANALGLTSADADGYMPSVPFVSQMAACLAVGRLLAILLDADTTTNWLQFDALHGPHREPHTRRPERDCTCQTRPEMIRCIRAGHSDA